jgi:hypothetical protein
MNSKYALNKFNCNKKENTINKVYNMKCRCLPKENRKEYKNILKTIQELKKY